jgi:hypothetical protein
MELLSLLLPLLDDEPDDDLPDFVSEVLLLVLEPDLAFGVDDLDSEPEDLLPLFEEDEDEPKPEEEEEPEPIPPWLLEPMLPWLLEPIPEPMPLWLEEDPISEPLLFEVPDEEPPDELPDWLDD